MSTVTKTRQRKGGAAESGASGLHPDPPPVLADKEERRDTRSMRTVFRSIVRSQTRALTFERLAVVVADLLRGGDSQPPQLLLKLPGGGAFAAEVDDVLEIEAELVRMGSAERMKLASLMASVVRVHARDVDRDQMPRGPNAPIPAGEGLLDNPGFRAASSVAAAATSRK